MSECNKCGASVFWAQMQTSGKNNLLDAEPSSVGDIVITDETTKPRMARTVSPRNWPDNPVRYRSHFVTCPKSATSEEMRRPGRGWEEEQ